MKAVTIRNASKKSIRILVTGDWHIGNPGSHDGGITRCITKARQCNYWLHLADAAECVLPGDKRFCIDEHGKVTPVGSWAKVVERIASAQKNCIGMLSGNHESAISKIIGNVSDFLCRFAGVPYLTQTALITITMPKGVFRWCALHGHMAFTGRGVDDEREALNREKRLRRYVASVIDAELYTLGHGHRAIVAPPVMKCLLKQDGDNVHRRPVEIVHSWVAMCPSMLRVYGKSETYAEARLLPPSDLGWLEIVVDTDGTIPTIFHYDEDGNLAHEYNRRVVA